MNNQANCVEKVVFETDANTASQSLDYLRMDNESFMEEYSVLSAGAWVERDDTGFECA